MGQNELQSGLAPGGNVKLYYRFPLSLRHVEELLAERGIDVSFQTVSEWAAKFGPEFTRRIRRRSAGGFAGKWHLDEVAITIKGKKHWLWRAVDAGGYVLEAIVQSRRNKQAALRLLRKLLKDQGHSPRVMVTDKLGSYSAARRQIMPGVEHRAHKGLNNRAENSHLAIRRRERNMKRSSQRDNVSVSSQPTVRSTISSMRPAIIWPPQITEISKSKHAPSGDKSL